MKRKSNELLTCLHWMRQHQGQQQDQIHDTSVLGGWAGTVHCHYNAKIKHKQFKCYKLMDQATDQQTRSPVSAKKELNIEMCVSGRRQFQYLAIINIRGAWEGALMDMVFIGPPYLSGVFLWSAYLRNRQELVTCFKIAHYFLISHDNLCSGSIFWKRIVLSKGSRLNTIKSS